MEKTLKEILDAYDKAGDVPAEGFSKEQLSKAAANQKIDELKKVIKKAENDIRKDAADFFEEFNVKFKYTSSDNKNLGESDINAIAFDFDNKEKQNLTISVNFNLSTIGKLAGVELYSVVYKTLHSALLKKKEAVGGGKNFKFGKEEELYQDQQSADDKNLDNEGKKAEKPLSLLDYIKKFLKEFFGYEQDFEGLDSNEISNLTVQDDYSKCAERIANNLASGGITPQDVFENPYGKNPVAERYTKVEKVESRQQAAHLLGVFSQKEFSDLKSNDPQSIRDFCEKYARTVLSMHGINEGEIGITFNSKDSIGNYVDYGNGQEININIDKIMKKNNPAEVIMTIQHELTHAIDSTKHKDGRNVYGLTNNLVGDRKKIAVSDNDIIPSGDSVKDDANKTNVENFINELKDICYKVNPNERSAREGELAAIEFMQGLHKDADEDMKKCIKNSIKNYNTYQTKVLQAIQKAPNMKNIFDSQYKSIVKESSGTYKTIEQMLNYIDSLDLSQFNEEQMIRDAKDAKKEMEDVEKEIKDVGPQIGD